MSENISSSFSQKSFNSKEFLQEFIRRRYLATAIIIVCLAVSYIYSCFFITPMYSSNAKIYVVNKNAEKLTSSDISVSSYLAYDFAEIINNDTILDKVAMSLDNKYSTSQLKSFISIDIPQSTRIISITVKSPNAEDSKKIVDSICTTAQSVVVEIMDLDKIEILNEGKIAKRPVSPVVTTYVFYGFMGGLAISFLIVFLIYSLDNKISSSNDVEKYLDITVLATIPYNSSKKSK